MKAPETIFLHGYFFDDEPCKNWTLEPLKKGMRGHTVQNEKYIRKDALLEWAEEEMMKAAKQSDSYGRRNAFMDVIDKLNSI